MSTVISESITNKLSAPYGQMPIFNLDCGHNAFNTYSRKLAIGEMIACEDCEREAADQRFIEDLDPKTVAYSRFSPRFGGQYLFYKRDFDSPTGVLLIGAVKATKMIDDLLRHKRLSPLSPTEMR